MKRLCLCLIAAGGMALVSACGSSSGPAGGQATESGKLSMWFGGAASAQVKWVKVRVVKLGMWEIAGTQAETDMLKIDCWLPTAVKEVEVEEGYQISGDSEHRFADALFILDPGRYRVCAIPEDGNKCKTDACAPVETVQNVWAEKTTEVTMISQCKGDPPGGLDVVTIFNDPPEITNLTIDPSKFIVLCGTPTDTVPVTTSATITITVTAMDPNDDPLKYDWKVVSGPDGSHSTVTWTDGTATFTTDEVGDYQLKVTVTEADPQLNQSVSLTFPIHVIPADTNSDPDNCGACGNVCKDGNACVSGQCVPFCGK